MTKVYEFEGKLFDEDGVACLIAENCMEMLIRKFGDDLRDFLEVLPDPIWDDIKDWLLEDMSGHCNYDMLGIEVKEVLGREQAIDYGARM